MPNTQEVDICPVCETPAQDKSRLCLECGWELGQTESDLIIGDPEELKREANRKQVRVAQYHKLYEQSQQLEEIKIHVEKLSHSLHDDTNQIKELKDDIRIDNKIQISYWVMGIAITLLLGLFLYQHIKLNSSNTNFEKFQQKQQRQVNSLNQQIDSLEASLTRINFIFPLELNKTKVFGPKSGALTHNSEDGYVKNDSAGVTLRNFIVEAKFSNPFHVSEGIWDHGFGFRDIGVEN